jgi:Fungal N-terminal domain of STAND proteins
MCEPLSIAASVLAVAGFAANSCECLYKTLRLLSEAPKDLQHHLTAVQALRSTFAGIAALEKEVPVAELITPEIKARLHACMLDLQAIERLAKSFHAQLEEGRVRRTWAKMRWSSLDQRRTLKSHLSRIESYHMNFSLDLLLINM